MISPKHNTHVTTKDLILAETLTNIDNYNYIVIVMSF